MSNDRVFALAFGGVMLSLMIVGMIHAIIASHKDKSFLIRNRLGDFWKHSSFRTIAREKFDLWAVVPIEDNLSTVSLQFIDENGACVGSLKRGAFSAQGEMSFAGQNYKITFTHDFRHTSQLFQNDKIIASLRAKGLSTAQIGLESARTFYANISGIIFTSQTREWLIAPGKLVGISHSPTVRRKTNLRIIAISKDLPTHDKAALLAFG